MSHPVIVFGGGDLGSVANNFRLPLYQPTPGMNSSCSQRPCCRQVDGDFLNGMLGVPFCSSYFNRGNLDKKEVTNKCISSRQLTLS